MSRKDPLIFFKIYRTHPFCTNQANAPFSIRRKDVWHIPNHLIGDTVRNEIRKKAKKLSSIFRIRYKSHATANSNKGQVWSALFCFVFNVVTLQKQAKIQRKIPLLSLSLLFLCFFVPCIKFPCAQSYQSPRFFAHPLPQFRRECAKSHRCAHLYPADGCLFW